MHFNSVFQAQVHPKTDLQRKNLAEAVKNILLFRSLDSVSLLMLYQPLYPLKSLHKPSYRFHSKRKMHGLAHGSMILDFQGMPSSCEC